MAQKEAIYSTMDGHRSAVIVFCLFLLLPLKVIFTEDAWFELGMGWLSILVLGGGMLGYLVWFLQSFAVYRELSKIQHASEEVVSITCSSISFLYKSIGRLMLIVCIVFKDEQGNRFYYVYPLDAAPNSSYKKNHIEYFTQRELTLTCYKGTNIVKSLPKMPRYWPNLF